MTVQENIPLSQHTTFRVGGPARFFVQAETAEDVRAALALAREHHLPWLVLGGGSNVLVRDEGFPGVVIHMGIKGISYKDEKDGLVMVTAGAGEDWDSLVAQTVARGLWGLENLSFIPGTVGGAPVQNIGAYGVEIKALVEHISVLNTDTDTVEVLPEPVCRFAYRDSIFKRPEGKKYIILGASFRLSSHAAPRLTYKDVVEYFKDSPQPPALQAVRDAIIDIRMRKLPRVQEVGTAGSFFKNPVVSQERASALRARYPDMRTFVAEGDSIKISAAWLLDQIAQAKTLSVGDAAVWNTQSLVLINRAAAKARDVERLADMLVERVLEGTGITLEREVVLI